NNWSAGAALGCNGCHGSDSAAGSFTSLAGEPNYSNAGTGTKVNTHQKHVKVGASDCVNCHSTTVTTAGTAIVGGATTHTNKAIDVVQGNGKTFTWTSGSKQCSNISCHNNGTAVWGATLACSNCHGTLGGAHATHMNALTTEMASRFSYDNYTANRSPASAGSQYGFGCASCHPVTSATHLNGSVQVEVNNVAGVGSLRAKNNASSAVSKVNVITSGSNVTCDQVYCHSDGFTALSASNGAATNWYVAFQSSAARCAQCHGNSPNTGAKAGLGSAAHAAHVVGVHQDDIFNGTSGKLAAGSTGSVSHGLAAQATSINCDTCHNVTITSTANDNNTACTTCHTGAKLRGESSINNLQYHVNGRANVDFKNIAIVSKAQIKPTSFSNYTSVWARSSYKVDGTSFDTAKKSLVTSTMWTAGVAGQGTCANISCHNGYSVKWNDAVTCLSCHSRL
ncbi:MAG TPA: CxxxxCH/CxxCH domain-containing protein, partial [Geobacteraceae bacterium]